MRKKDQRILELVVIAVAAGILYFRQINTVYGVIIIALFIISFEYTFRRQTMLTNQLWRLADELHLTPELLEDRIQYKGGIDLAKTRPENPERVLSVTELKRIIYLLNQMKTSHTR